MRLTLINLFRHTPNGHLFRGKERLVKKVTRRGMDNLIREFEQQEENMLYLRHPYLTVAESSGHAQALGKREALLKKWKEDKLKMKPHITIESRLSHLKVKECWD